MEPVAIIVQQPDILWGRFIAACQEHIGRSPTRELDKARIQPGLPHSFIPTLGEFQHAGTAPIPYIKSVESDPALEQIYYSLLIACDEKVMTGFIRLQNLKIMLADDSETAVATGNLLEWRRVIVQGTHPSVSKNLRILVNRIQHAFSHVGLGLLWQDLVRQTTSDGTIAFIPKK